MANARFEEVNVAVDAGIRISEFERMPVREKADYIARSRVQSAMQDYERHLADKKNRRKGSGRQHG